MDRLSYRLFFALIAVFALLTVAEVMLPGLVPADLPMPRWQAALANGAVALILYGALGGLGLFLAGKLGWAPAWTGRAGARARLLTPLLWGIGLGLFFILVDAGLSALPGSAPLPHPPFPTSLVASAAAGIGEETLFRLFLIPFWVWLISKVILRGHGEEPVFWAVAIFAALAFAFGHLPSAMALMGYTDLGQIHANVWIEMMLLNGTLSLVAALMLRRSGYLAAMGLHFWTDVVWHVLWGAVS